MQAWLYCFTMRQKTTSKGFLMMTKKCKFCGKEFEGAKLRLYCDRKCKSRHAAEKDKAKRSDLAKKGHNTCKNCGSKFSGRKKAFCDIQCCRKYSNRKKNGEDLSVFCDKSSIDKKTKPEKECSNCGKHFKPKNNGGSTGNKEQTYCSKKCAGEAIRKKSEPKRQEEKKQKEERAKIRAKNIENKRNKKIEEKKEKDKLAAKCKSCGKEITQTYKNCKKYCDICIKEKKKTASKKYKKRYAHNRSHKKRAERFNVIYEKINRVKVFDSDNWTCQCCGKKTPKSLMKSFGHPDAPTLDHIKPISIGGDHLYYNLQLLCRECNTIKSNEWKESDQNYIHKLFEGLFGATFKPCKENGMVVRLSA